MLGFWESPSRGQSHGHADQPEDTRVDVQIIGEEDDITGNRHVESGDYEDDTQHNTSDWGGEQFRIVDVDSPELVADGQFRGQPQNWY